MCVRVRACVCVCVDYACIGEPMVVKFCLLLCYYAFDHACIGEPMMAKLAGTFNSMIHCYSVSRCVSMAWFCGTRRAREGSTTNLKDDYHQEWNNAPTWTQSATQRQSTALSGLNPCRKDAGTAGR